MLGMSAVRKITVEVPEKDLAAARAIHGQPLYYQSISSPRVIYGRLAIGGAILFLLPFAAIAGPLAFVQRRVLLTNPDLTADLRRKPSYRPVAARPS